MEWLNIITNKEVSFHHVITLVAAIILTSAGMMALITFLDNYIQNIYPLLFLWLIIEIIIIILWYHHRYIYPKGNSQKENLVIAITTENNKQKTRIKKDFADEIRKQLRIYGLSNTFEVTILHNYQSKQIQKKINLWYETKNVKMLKSDHFHSFNKISQRLGAKFYIFGDLIRRNLKNSTYYMSTNALIKHGTAPKVVKKNLEREFSQLWQSEISILEDEELNEFRNNAKDIFFSATYMIGLATFIDNKYEEGLKIWNTLERYVSQNSHLDKFAKKINDLKYTCLYLYSRMLYFQGDIERSVTYKKQYLKISPNKYEEHLVEAINQIKYKGNPNMALVHIEKAKKLSVEDGTWRYSKLYLLIYMGRIEEALRIFDKILSYNFRNENDTIYQVISYNESCIEQDENHIQSHFIIGSFLYKKLDLPIQAYERLQKFIDSAGENMNPLKKRAVKYIQEIDKIIDE